MPMKVPVACEEPFREGLVCPTCPQCCRDKNEGSTAPCQFPVWITYQYKLNLDKA